jgi:TRAP-type C4-dicarboxylate transport system substrate-binding protein
MNRIQAFGVALSLAILAVLAATPAEAQQRVRVLGGFTGLLQSDKVERPFFESLGKNMGNAFTVEYRGINEVGLKGFDAIRQLESGLFHFLAMPSGYVSGDAPFFMGMDIPGLTPDFATARRAVNAYRPLVDEQLQKKYNGKLLGMWPYPPNILFCKGPISGVDGLKGKKVRVYSSPLSVLFQNFGAVGVTISFSEVYQSLQRGLIDCAITGSLPGYSSKLYEVSDHLYPLPILFAVQMHVVNNDFWKKLDAGQQQKLAALFKEMEDEMWAVAEKSNSEGVECNTGGKCAHGPAAKMKLVNVTDADRKAMAEVARQSVLPSWTKECTASLPDCVQLWNGSIGKVVGITAK